MINYIWFLMIIIGVGTASIRGEIDIITNAAVDGAEQAVVVAFGLIGIIAFWSGIMKIAQDAGIIKFLSRLMHPLAKILFPDIPNEHPAMGAIVLSMSANLLGLGNACTPLGIKAMEELQSLNQNSDKASNSMCTFLAITTSSLTLIPGTVIAFRVAQGSNNPTEIIGTSIIATLTSTIIAIFVDRLLRNLVK